MFQDHRLLSDRTVFDNVALPLVIAGHPHQEIQRRVRAALDKVNLLQRERAYPVTLSGGEQQRVGIARAVVHRPVLLLADEPTGNLDPALSWEIMNLFERFNQVGVTVLIASHDLEMVKKMRKKIITLRKGRLLTHIGETIKRMNRRKRSATRASRSSNRSSRFLNIWVQQHLQAFFFSLGQLYRYPFSSPFDCCSDRHSVGPACRFLPGA